MNRWAGICRPPAEHAPRQNKKGAGRFAVLATAGGLRLVRCMIRLQPEYKPGKGNGGPAKDGTVLQRSVPSTTWL